MNETALVESGLQPRTLTELMEYAKMIAKTEMVPKALRDKPGEIVVAAQFGAELGFKFLQSLQSVAVINGRPGIYGDAFWALIKSHPLCEWTDDSFDSGTMTWTCSVKRRGSPVVIRSFSKADATQANLWNKDGPWKQYPQRMLMWRARTYAGRDALPEALKGLPVAEDTIRDMGTIERVDDYPEPQPAKPPQPVPAPTEPAPAPAPAPSTPPATEDFTPPDLITPGQADRLRDSLARRNLREVFNQHFDITDPSELPRSRLQDAIKWIEGRER